MALTEDQQEALDTANELVDYATGQQGWTKDKAGVNAKYGWARITKGDWKLQAFYTVDCNAEDKFIFGSDTVDISMVKAIIDSQDINDLADVMSKYGSRAYAKEIAAALQAQATHEVVVSHVDTEPATEAPVPPTVPPTTGAVPPTGTEASAAHTDPVPPTMPVPVPPTFTDEDAAHLTSLPFDEAWKWLDDRCAKFGYVSPKEHEFRKNMSPETHGKPKLTTPDDDEYWEAREAQAHHEQAGGDPANQADTLEAVRAQQAMGVRRNWSPVASPLTDAELLKAVAGNEITWRNRISRSKDHALVCTVKEAGKHQAKITPIDFDAEAAGEDMRVLHFLEKGAGFRSVAVSQIIEIG